MVGLLDPSFSLRPFDVRPFTEVVIWDGASSFEVTGGREKVEWGEKSERQISRGSSYRMQEGWEWREGLGEELGGWEVPKRGVKLCQPCHLIWSHSRSINPILLMAASHVVCGSSMSQDTWRPERIWHRKLRETKQLCF